MSKIDWTNKDHVLSYAKRLGKGMSVFWNGRNYQITHTETEDRSKSHCSKAGLQFVIVHRT